MSGKCPCLKEIDETLKTVIHQFPDSWRRLVKAYASNGSQHKTAAYCRKYGNVPARNLAPEPLQRGEKHIYKPKCQAYYSTSGYHVSYDTYYQEQCNIEYFLPCRCSGIPLEIAQPEQYGGESYAGSIKTHSYAVQADIMLKILCCRNKYCLHKILQESTVVYHKRQDAMSGAHYSQIQEYMLQRSLAINLPHEPYHTIRTSEPYGH